LARSNSAWANRLRPWPPELPQDASRFQLLQPGLIGSQFRFTLIKLSSLISLLPGQRRLSLRQLRMGRLQSGSLAIPLS